MNVLICFYFTDSDVQDVAHTLMSMKGLSSGSKYLQFHSPPNFLKMLAFDFLENGPRSIYGRWYFHHPYNIFQLYIVNLLKVY